MFGLITHPDYVFLRYQDNGAKAWIWDHTWQAFSVELQIKGVSAVKGDGKGLQT